MPSSAPCAEVDGDGGGGGVQIEGATRNAMGRAEVCVRVCVVRIQRRCSYFSSPEQPGKENKLADGRRENLAWRRWSDHRRALQCGARSEDSTCWPVVKTAWTMAAASRKFYYHAYAPGLTWESNTPQFTPGAKVENAFQKRSVSRSSSTSSRDFQDRAIIIVRACIYRYNNDDLFFQTLRVAVHLFPFCQVFELNNGYIFAV